MTTTSEQAYYDKQARDGFADGVAAAQEADENWIAVRCHLCGKVKDAATEARALYLLAFHYDRRHRGWTQPGVI